MKLYLKEKTLEHVDECENMGIVLMLLAKMYPTQNISMAYINKILRPAIEHNQLAIFYNDQNDPVAFIIWCKITEDTLYRIEKNLHYDFHISEWDEGDLIWVHNLYTFSDVLISSMKFIKNKLFKDENVLYFNRKCKVHRQIINNKRVVQ